MTPVNLKMKHNFSTTPLLRKPRNLNDGNFSRETDTQKGLSTFEMW